MKKFAALLAVCVVSLFVGCGGEAPKEPAKTAAPTATAEAKTGEPAKTEAAAPAKTEEAK